MSIKRIKTDKTSKNDDESKIKYQKNAVYLLKNEMIIHRD